MEDGNLRTANDSFEYPSNIEAEQALLGTLLLNNDSFDRIKVKNIWCSNEMYDDFNLLITLKNKSVVLFEKKYLLNFVCQ